MNNNQDLKDKLAKHYESIALKHFQYKEAKSKEQIEFNRQKIKLLLEENEKILEKQLKSSKRRTFSDHAKLLKVNDSMGKRSIMLKFQDFQPHGPVKSKLIKARLFSIPHVEPIPKYTMWTSVVRNIKTKDDPVLRHLYYFGEGAEHDLDIDFYMDVFDKVDFGSSKFDTDVEKIFFKTCDHFFNQSEIELNVIENFLNERKSGLKVIITKKNRDFIIDEIINSFPSVINKKCKKQLQTEIEDRVKEFSPSDKINGEDISEAFKSLWCINQLPQKVTKKLHPAPKLNEKPCKKNCYRYLTEEVDCNEQSLESEWNDEEITLFNKLREVFGTKSYCTLATIIKSKLCKEVYQRSQFVGNIIASNDEEPRIINKKASKRAVIIENDAYKQAEYSPCYHPGEDCTSAECSCLKGNLHCEKYCHCERRFQGCKCYSGDNVCGTKKCSCFEHNRECDFDICKCPAGVQCVYNSDAYCKNVMVQRGRSKSTIIGLSTVAGWGLFMREEARKSEYIGEYLGEIISHAEADRRGKIYDKRRCSFLFNLNIDTVIDATRKGNKLRFINHSNSPNTNCRVVMANGEHHIAIYASQLIKPGEELFYDYRYDGQALEFVPIERKQINKSKRK
ncbi:2126_t:CDS:10 [Entrophospora sp. SA101]|nr:5414_t:CDS:10 [Entrophospora sp. SA101]CAJ0856624.1 2126_t:CDS:10 [Entrophospora sp. SA101]